MMYPPGILAPHLVCQLQCALYGFNIFLNHDLIAFGVSSLRLISSSLGITLFVHDTSRWLYLLFINLGYMIMKNDDSIGIAFRKTHLKFLVELFYHNRSTSMTSIIRLVC